MATTYTTNTRQVGHWGTTIWKATFDGANDETAKIVVDLSGLASGNTTGLRVRKVQIVSTTGIAVNVEFDATANQQIATAPEGYAGPVDFCFYNAPDGAQVKTAAGSTGDIVVTTLGAALGDIVYIYIEWRAF